MRELARIAALFGGLPHAKLLSPWVTNVTDGNLLLSYFAFFYAGVPLR